MAASHSPLSHSMRDRRYLHTHTVLSINAWQHPTLLCRTACETDDSYTHIQSSLSMHGSIPLSSVAQHARQTIATHTYSPLYQCMAASHSPLSHSMRDRR